LQVFFKCVPILAQLFGNVKAAILTEMMFCIIIKTAEFRGLLPTRKLYYFSVLSSFHRIPWDSEAANSELELFKKIVNSENGSF
jgi:hypothetical protein